MHEYVVYYTFKGVAPIDDYLFETCVTAENSREARRIAREDLSEWYKIVKVLRVWQKDV